MHCGGAVVESNCLENMYYIVNIKDACAYGGAVAENFTLEDAYYIASIAGVFLTLIALGFAYYIPIKIAREQNKIALFKMRYDTFFKYQQFVKCSNVLYKFLEFSTFQTLLKGIYPPEYEKYIIWLRSFSFLFPTKPEIVFENFDNTKKTDNEITGYILKSLQLMTKETAQFNLLSEKIELQFELDSNELINHSAILKRTLKIFSYVTEASVTSDDLINSIKELTELIAKTNILVTLKEQVNLNS